MRFFKRLRPLALTLIALFAFILIAKNAAASPFITMASTTSTEQSGLFAHLLPAFKRASGIDIKVVALGTGQALDMARRGDADVVFVHDQAAEEKFVADGWGLQRHPVMFNDFILVGPQNDPAGAGTVAGTRPDIVAALQKLAAANAPFISRGDKSGTHSAELRYWRLSGTGAPQGTGYKACGCGMGAALNMAAASGAYVLTDRGTWLHFKNRAGLKVLVEGDSRLFNQYGVMVVNPARHPHTKTRQAQQFVDWVTSPAGQAHIAAYKIGATPDGQDCGYCRSAAAVGAGEQVFFPNAGR